MKLTPKILKFILNIYGPYFGAGVTVRHISPDWQRIDVSMKLRWYNRNIFGTHFGGSLYSMTDPHLVLMLMNLLGPGYIIWDQSATIDFIRPGTGTVYASFRITDESLQTIIEHVAQRGKYSPEFTVVVTDQKNKTVARIKKIIYIRKKRSD